MKKQKWTIFKTLVTLIAVQGTSHSKYRPKTQITWKINEYQNVIYDMNNLYLQKV